MLLPTLASLFTSSSWAAMEVEVLHLAVLSGTGGLSGTDPRNLSRPFLKVLSVQSVMPLISPHLL